MEQILNSSKRQKMLGVSLRSYQLVKLLATTGKRKLSQQIEFLAEEECKRQGIVIPAEIMED